MNIINERKIKKHIDYNGLDISLEVLVGEERKGKSSSGETWSRTIKSNYGYIKGTMSPDGEKLDCWVRKNPKQNADIYIVHQMTVDGKIFDEDKVMIGYSNAGEAEKAYKLEMPFPLKQYGGMSNFTLDHFKVIAYQASSSKAMLAPEKIIEKFRDKGFLKKQIKSPVEIAKKVSESKIFNLLLTVPLMIESLKWASKNKLTEDHIDKYIIKLIKNSRPGNILGSTSE